MSDFQEYVDLVFLDDSKTEEEKLLELEQIIKQINKIRES